MKKLLLSIVALLTITICFGFKSMAATSEDITNLKTAFYNKYGVQLGDTFASNVIDKWETVKSTNPYLYCQKISTNYGFRWGTAPTVNGQYWDFRGYQMSAQPANYTGAISFISNEEASMSVSIANGFYVGPYDSWHTVPIDWDNPLYSANIPTPNFEVTYRNLTATPIVDVPLNVNVTNGRETLYIEVKACFELPRRIYVDYDRPFGRYVYSGASRSLAVWEDVIAKEDLRASNNTSLDYIHTQLVSAWQDNYNAVALTDDDWYFSDLIPSGMYYTIKARYENLRKVCCFYGNQMKIMVRYFSIQNDTQFVVGAWRVWKNSDPNNFYDELPEYYEPYFPASGSSGTLISVESTPDPETVIPPGSGTPTGTYYTPGINITVGQNVPNYPDYPTIRSYNADNFLVQTMNYLDYFNDPDTEHDLFGEFGGFLKTVFVFIPGEIWSIIAVGFCLVIVVMFLKIL